MSASSIADRRGDRRRCRCCCWLGSTLGPPTANSARPRSPFWSSPAWFCVLTRLGQHHGDLAERCSAPESSIWLRNCSKPPRVPPVIWLVMSVLPAAASATDPADRIERIRCGVNVAALSADHQRLAAADDRRSASRPSAAYGSDIDVLRQLIDQLVALIEQAVGRLLRSAVVAPP